MTRDRPLTVAREAHASRATVCDITGWDEGSGGSVPVGYLVNVLVAAVGTLFALVSLERPRAVARLRFRLGLLLGEVPVLGLYWLAAGTALAFAQGDVRGAGSWCVVGAAVVVAAGLGVVLRREVRAGAVVEAALREGLGTPATGRIGRLTPGRLASFLLRPVLPRRHRGVERVANLRYGDAGRRNLVDLYRHRSRPTGAPVLIHLHGGGYRQGRKSTQSMDLVLRMAARGWICLSANYRLQPAVRHPEHLIDLKRLIAWVREDGPSHGADPAVVVVTGSSAGGHMAALAALTPGDPAFQPGFESADTSVTAAVCLGAHLGPYDGVDPLTSPFGHVRAGAPPFLVVHGGSDPMAPAANARRFADTLRAVSVNPVVYAELPGGQHSFDLFRSPRYAAVVDGIEEFTDRVTGGR